MNWIQIVALIGAGIALFAGYQQGFQIRALDFVFLIVDAVLLFLFYRPFFRWYDAASFHYRLAFYLFGLIAAFLFLTVSVSASASSKALSEGFAFLHFLTLFALLLGFARQVTKKPAEPTQPETPQAAAPPPVPEPPKPARSIEDRIEDLLKQNRR